MAQGSYTIKINPTLDKAEMDRISAKIKELKSVFGEEVKIHFDMDWTKEIPKATEGVRELGKELNNAGSALRTFADISLVMQGMQMLTSQFKDVRDHAMQFNRSLGMIGTLGAKNFKELREPILELTKVLPYTANEIARSIYFGADVMGGLIDVADTMKYVEQTGKLAVATLSDLDTTTSLMNATMKAFRAPAEEVAKYTDAFAYAFSKADLPINQLATNFGNIAGQARNLGVSVEESLAALVEMRNSGATTATAMTQLGALMTALQKPSKGMATIMKEVGVNTASIRTDGLVESLRKIEEAARASGKSMPELLGRIEAQRASVALLGSNYEQTAANIETFKQEMEGMTDVAFNVQFELFDQDFVKNEIERIKILLGEAFGGFADGFIMALPHLTGVVSLIGQADRMVANLKTGWGLMVGFVDKVFIENTKLVASKASALALQIKENIAISVKTGLLAKAGVVGAAAGVATSIAFSPIIAIPLAIGAIIAGFVLLYNNVDGVKQVVGSIWEVLKAVVGMVITIGKLVVGVLLAPWLLLKAGVEKVLENFGVAGSLLDGISKFAIYIRDTILEWKYALDGFLSKIPIIGQMFKKEVPEELPVDIVAKYELDADSIKDFKKDLDGRSGIIKDNEEQIKKLQDTGRHHEATALRRQTEELKGEYNERSRAFQQYQSDKEWAEKEARERRADYDAQMVADYGTMLRGMEDDDKSTAQQKRLMILEERRQWVALSQARIDASSNATEEEMKHLRKRHDWNMRHLAAAEQAMLDEGFSTQAEKQKKQRSQRATDYKRELERQRRDNLKTDELYSASLIANAEERSQAVMAINQKYALLELQAQKDNLDKKGKHYTEYLEALNEKERLLRQTHSQELARLIAKQSAEEFKAQREAQTKIFADLRKLSEWQLRNTEDMDAESIKRRYELRVLLAKKGQEEEIKAVIAGDEEYKRLLEEMATTEDAMGQEALKFRLAEREKAIRASNEIVKEIEKSTAIELKKLEGDKQAELTEVAIQGITDRSKRMLALNIDSINKKYNEEIARFKGQTAIIERLEKERQQAIRKAQLDAARENMLLITKISIEGARRSVQAIEQASLVRMQGKRDLETMRLNHKDQENELRASLLRREIEQEEFHQRLSELSIKAQEEQLAKEKEILQQRRDAYASIFSDLKDSIALNFDAMTDKLIEYSEVEDGVFKMSEAGTQVVQDAYVVMGATMASTFAQSLLEGKSALKALVLMALDGLQAFAQIQIAMATAKEVGNKGIFGLGTAAVIAAAVQALVAVAKSAVNSMNFFKGGLVEGGVLHKDSVNANLAKHEFVVRNKVVRKGDSLDFLKNWNNSNLSVEEFIMNHPSNRNLRELISSAEWGSSSKHLNDIVANKQIFIQMDTAPIVEKLYDLENELTKTNHKLDGVAGVIAHKDTTVVNKIYAKDVYAKREKSFRGV